ncbi:MAG: hypothetical protein OEV61_09545 [Chloroflexota bacterium]|jgi:hypothetical protein|nr:hypothetical protein [Chloroflexota bacterium]MDH5244064.1 hypothetical protein [Chloroflexota bacterium]
MTTDDRANDHSSEIARLAAIRAAYAALAPQVAAGEPWPLAEAFGTEPEASWGPREVLAHVVEMLPFWLGELERVVDGTPEPVPFGRNANDAVRIGLIGRERTLPLRVLFERIDGGLEAWSDRLTTLTEPERDKVGLHPRLGEMRCDAITGRFVLGHAEEHVAQLEAIIATRSGD